jgi:hypothetical protein
VPNYYCQGSEDLVAGRGSQRRNVGRLAIEAAVTEALLAVLVSAALQACLATTKELEAGHDATLAS